jgi:hypothetical protein
MGIWVVVPPCPLPPASESAEENAAGLRSKLVSAQSGHRSTTLTSTLLPLSEIRMETFKREMEGGGAGHR